MPKRKGDPDERTRFRSILPTVAAEIVDHRLLIQLGLVLAATVSLATWGPDGVRNGLITVMASPPVRQVQRLTHVVWSAVVDGLQAVDPITPRATVTAIADDTAALSKEATSTPEVVRGTNAPSVAASQRPAATSEPSQVVPPSEALTLAGAAAEKPDEDPADAILWLLEKDAETIRAEMHDRGKPGVDLLLFRNGQLWRRERWAERTAARNEARKKRVEFEKNGWTARPI
jgi:hypothetical protein